MALQSIICSALAVVAAACSGDCLADQATEQLVLVQRHASKQELVKADDSLSRDHTEPPCFTNPADPNGELICDTSATTSELVQGPGSGYELSAPGTLCSSGQQLSSADQCKEGAKIVGKTYVMQYDWGTSFQAGCFEFDGKAYFNTAAVGTTSIGSHLASICGEGAAEAACQCLQCGTTTAGPWQSGSCAAGASPAGNNCKSTGGASGCYSSSDDFGCNCPGTLGDAYAGSKGPYLSEDGALCPSGDQISSADQCKEGAKIVGKQYVMQYDWGTSFQAGCFEFDGKAYFNKAAVGTTSIGKHLASICGASEATPARTPTRTPTQSPTDSPTQSPTDSPTQSPTDSPTQSPTMRPTHPAECHDWCAGDSRGFPRVCSFQACSECVECGGHGGGAGHL